MQFIDGISKDIFIENEDEKKDSFEDVKVSSAICENMMFNWNGKKYEGMKKVEICLEENELKTYYLFNLASLFILNLQYNKARELLENCYIDLEELLLLKALVYSKLQILTSHEICLNMLSEDYQRKYKTLVSKDTNSQIVIEECSKIRENYQCQIMSYLECKKIIWKEMLIKANESFKQSLAELVCRKKDGYINCEGFEELVLGPKNLQNCLLVLGHIIRMWLLMPDHALNFYNQAAAVDNTKASPYFFLGVTLRAKNENEKAILMYEKALSLNQNYADCLFNLGNIYLEQKKDYEKAIDCYKRALESMKKEQEIAPIINIGRIYNLLGEVYKQKEELSIAFNWYLEGIKEEYTYYENYNDINEICIKNQILEIGILIEYIMHIIDGTIQENEYEWNKDNSVLIYKYKGNDISEIVTIIENKLKTQSYNKDIKSLLYGLYNTFDNITDKNILQKEQLILLNILLNNLNFLKEEI